MDCKFVFCLGGLLSTDMWYLAIGNTVLMLDSFVICIIKLGEQVAHTDDGDSRTPRNIDCASCHEIPYSESS